MAARVSVKGALALTLVLSAPVWALQALDDAALGQVTGQDGLTVSFGGDGFSADRIQLESDRGAAAAGSCAGGVADQHGCVRLDTVSFGSDGAPFSMDIDIDAGQVGGDNALSISSSWNNALLEVGSASILGDAANLSARSYGAFALYTQGTLDLIARSGLLNSTNGKVFLDLQTTGDWIYRQGAAGTSELSLANIDIGLRTTNGAAGGQADAYGALGLTSDGLALTADHLDFGLEFDLMFKQSPVDFDRTGRSPIILLGWIGGLTDYTLKVGSGGLGYGTYASGGSTYADFNGAQTGARSEGIHFDASWSFDTDFEWRIGEAGGNRTQVRFGQWQRLGSGTGPMLSMPIILDLVQNGQGPGGLCFGGGFASGSPVQGSCTAAGGEWFADGVDAGELALATLIRDGYLKAYSTNVTVIDPAAAGAPGSYNWTMLYTFGKLDANILLHPQGRADGAAAVNTDTGLRADVTLAIQSPGHWADANSASAATRAGADANWANNSHFMFGDTAVGGGAGQYGFGLLNADVLWRVEDLYLRISDGDAAVPDLPAGLWLQTDTLAQYRFRGVLGGANLLDMTDRSAMALADINLSTDRFIFTLNPETPVAGAAPIGFNGLLNFDGNAYVKLGEVSNPASAWELTNVSGTVAWANGSVSLVSGQNTADGKPQLTIANDLLFGTSAGFGGVAGTPLVGSVGFGGENFGRIALPAGNWNSDITVKIPGN